MSLIQNRGISSFLGVAVEPAPPAPAPAATGTFGGLIVDGNTNLTNIAVGGTWYDFDLDLIAFLASSTVDWIVSDQATGELTYQGSETFKGLLFTTLTVTSPSGNRVFSFRAVKNGSSIAPENVRVSNNGITHPETISYFTPLTMVSGDTVRFQATMAIASNGNLDITDMSMQAWPTG